ncbi:PREDICTED: PITH domain-containing protein CG6153 [Dinoponera quadriceps]|uniref:PITH domain-containing protein CG6153 n=1 Tax=Dinoponera quadriceps TaxID=609295 RepID=A0A6P3XWH1_DINQU|nr:PREDICTED: PITH domain-containing protein CG6153 [Dinoponera quadriceps]
MERCHNCGEHTKTDSGPCCTLYNKIDIARVQCLNECTEGTGATVFKPWEERLNRIKFVESDVDAELLFNIPFTGNVKLKSIIVIADEELEPNTVKLFKNRPNMVFDDVISPDQEFHLQRDPHGLIEYPVKTVKFSSVNHLSLYFHGIGEQIRIYYIGLRGEWTPSHQHGVTICAYEARPLISDHTHSFSPVSNIHIK